MGVFVKGMEMPKCCYGCQFNCDQMMCRITGTRWWSDTIVLADFDSEKERLHDCLLIELPFAEELAEKLYKQIEKAVIEGSET